MVQNFYTQLKRITILPADEQQEFFDAVVDLRAKRVVEGLERLKAGVNAAPVDRRVQKFVQLRDARAASNKEADNLDKQYKEALKSIENSLIATAREQGVNGFKTDHGTTYLEETTLGSIADENAFYSFVRETGDLDFFERRIKAGHIKEYMEQNDGKLPPGLNIFRELTMKVRRS